MTQQAPTNESTPVEIPKNVTDAIGMGVIAALIVGVLTILFHAYLIGSGLDSGLMTDILGASAEDAGYGIAEGILFLALAFGIHRKSRFAATLAFGLFVVSKTLWLSQIGLTTGRFPTGHVVVAGMFGLWLFKAMVMTYRHRRLHAVAQGDDGDGGQVEGVSSPWRVLRGEGEHGGQRADRGERVALERDEYIGWGVWLGLGSLVLNAIIVGRAGGWLEPLWTLGWIFGRTVGYLLGFAALAGIFALAYRLVGRPMNWTQFLWVATVLVVLSAFGTLMR